jgi:hypothetical protein
MFWAPELFDSTYPESQSKEMDVWAFGMIVYVSLVCFGVFVVDVNKISGASDAETTV